MNNMSLQHVSPLKGLSSGSMTAKFQQQGQHNDLPDVKFNSSGKEMKTIKWEQVFLCIVD